MSLRAAPFALALALLFPGFAGAQPSPLTSIVPASVRIVEGRTTGPLDAGATFTVTVNDPVGAPIPGAYVYLDFSGCPHVQPASEQPFPGVTVVSCAPPVLREIADAAGVATFVITGAVVSRLAPGTGAGCIVVSAQAPPVAIGAITPSAFDQDGVNGLTANDLSLFFCDFGAGTNLPRSDLSGDGSINALDLSLWIAEFTTSWDRTRTNPRCDGGANTTPQISPPRGGLFLNWNDCAAAGGVKTRLFGCAVNTGVDQLRASFVAPAGVDALTGFEAELQIVGAAGVPLPDWWRAFVGGCRAPTSVSETTGLIGTAPECEQPNEGSWVSGSQTVFPAPNGATDREFVRIVGTFTPPGIALTAGQEYSLFNLLLNHQRTTGVGSCAGCATPMAILFDRLKLTQPATAAGGCGSPAIAASVSGAKPRAATSLTGDYTMLPLMTGNDFVAYWQGVPPGFVVSDVPPLSAAPLELALMADNPARGVSRLALTLPRGGHCRVVLFDVAGRARRVLADRSFESGTHVLDWDGRDESGQPLASGYYVWRAMTESGVVTRPQIQVR